MPEVQFGVRRETFDTKYSFIHLKIDAEKQISLSSLFKKRG